MFRLSVIRRVPYIAGIPLLDRTHKYDKNILEMPPETQDENQTGWSRLKKMYMKDDYYELSLELRNVMHGTMTGAFIGACLGGFVQSKEAYQYFIENNQATIFKSPMDARKKLQNYVTVAFGRGAVHWGWRLAAFTGMFSLVSTSVAVYRGREGGAEWAAGGAVAGAMYRATLGLAAATVGGVLGCALGAAAGLAVQAVLWATGLSRAELRRTIVALEESREQHYQSAVDKSSEHRDDDLTLAHDVAVRERGATPLAQL